MYWVPVVPNGAVHAQCVAVSFVFGSLCPRFFKFWARQMSLLTIFRRLARRRMVLVEILWGCWRSCVHFETWILKIFVPSESQSLQVAYRLESVLCVVLQKLGGWLSTTLKHEHICSSDQCVQCKTISPMFSFSLATPLPLKLFFAKVPLQKQSCRLHFLYSSWSSLLFTFAKKISSFATLRYVTLRFVTLRCSKKRKLQNKILLKSKNRNQAKTLTNSKIWPQLYVSPCNISFF